MPGEKKMEVKRKKKCHGVFLLPGLPDGLFSNQKSQFGQFFEGLRLEKVNICYGHLE
jgi:hypothetical protein